MSMINFDVEMIETWNGWEVRVRDGKWWKYVTNVYNGEYTFDRDYAYAKHFTKETAMRHVKALGGSTMDRTRAVELLKGQIEVNKDWLNGMKTIDDRIPFEELIEALEIAVNVLNEKGE